MPLHSSPAGRRFGRAHGKLPVTDDLSDRLVRLPLWVGLQNEMPALLEEIAATILATLRPSGKPAARSRT